ncbi:tyrosine-protein phosphatase [Nonomuraea sediminis]|uniref:tyrosine-protein phosphatase n=1 Tax=Nonomuraea sediminis TaxID=2835864 RepID=UPI001BDD81FA|nr:tyrosine-protein phosphatase [Nonomuraea sediminis]
MPLLNLRDVATAGASLRPGVLYRSAQPHSLSAEDVELVSRLRLIADLRGARERTEDDWDPGLRVIRLGPDEAGSPASLPPDMPLGELYVLLLDHRTAWFARVVGEIADGLPALVHCAAGKDRTGIVVALILDLLGVGHDAIVRDYALTADHLPAVLEMLAVREEVGPALRQAPESAMRTLLAALEERGGAEKLLVAHGLDPERVSRLRRAMLEP